MCDFIENFKTQSEQLAERFLSNGRVTTYLKGHAAAADECIRELAKTEELGDEIAIVAIGGYGRKELFPHSDLDVMVLLPEEPDEETGKKIEHFFMRLWDMGLTVGNSVRTVESALTESAKDITVQTALLESRLISGNELLFARLQKEFFNQMDAPAFYQAKALELRQRHQKYEDTPFALEPNLKESPGGLRDLQVLFWCSHAAGMGSTAEEMLAAGTISSDEADKLKEALHALKTFRIYLHLIAKRHEDRLIFDLQTRVAQAAGYKDTEHQLASEALMKRYYLTAKSVSQLSEIFMRMFENKFFPEDYVHETVIDRTFIARGYTLDITHDGAFKDDPNALLRAFYLLESSAPLKRLSVSLLRELMSARELINDRFREDSANKHMLMQIIKMPHGVSHALLDLNQWGILGLFLPEFQHIVGQMQHDLFHTYTVDQHTMRVVRNLRYFTRSEYAHEYPICTRIMQTMKDSWRLVLAALFHDVGKGLGGQHEKLGAQIVQKFCERFGIDLETTELLVFLVREHLTMSLVAQKQDISDPDVIRDFAERVGSERYLTALYLLTVADIRGTNPQIWNAWKSKLLEDLFHLTLRVLGGEEISVDHELKKRQKEALATLRLYGLPEDAHVAFWKQLDIVYFLRHDASDIAWQTRTLYWRANSSEPVVKCRLSPIGEGLQVTVYMLDRADLFARICSYFDRKNFSILDAKIHTTIHDYALDTFLVTRQGFEKNYRDIISLVEHELTELLKSPSELPPPSKPRLSRKSRSFPVSPTLDLRPDASGKCFVLSITANDRTGLLYSIAQVFSRYKVNLHTAKIMTLGERIEDVFLIDSEMLQHPRAQIQFETDMIDILKID